MKTAEKPQNTLMVIDGHAMAYRAHFAMMQQGLTNAEGMPTGAIHGFFRMVLKLLNDFHPEYFLIVFDPKKPTFRSEMYPEYKQNREKMPDELRLQLDEIQNIASELGLPVFIPSNEEADDAMASIAEQNKDNNIQVILVSSDKDLFNILHPNVKMLRARKGVSDFITIDAHYVKTELGIDISQIPDFMALTGDASDNVPGVKGVGEKTAVKLIQQYKTLQNLFEKVETVKPAGVQKKLIDNKENALLSLDLVRLKKDLKLKLEFDKLDLKKIPRLYKNAMVLKKGGFQTIYNDWLKFFRPETSDEDMFSSAANEAESSFSIIYNRKAFQSEIKNALPGKPFAIFPVNDTQSYIGASMIGIAMAFHVKDRLNCIYVQLKNQIKEPHLDYQQCTDAVEIAELLKKTLENKNSEIVAFDSKSDLMLLESLGINRATIQHDCSIYSFLINPNQKSTIEEAAESFLSRSITPLKEVTGAGKKQVLPSEAHLEALADYSMQRALVILEVFPIVHEQVQKLGLARLYKKIDYPLVTVLKEMEQHGVLVDINYLEQLQSEYESRRLDCEKKIYNLAGQEFNIQSTKDLQFILFEKMGIRAIKKTEKGAYSTDHSVLLQLKEEHEIIREILKYRALAKLLSTYIQPLPMQVSTDTGRLHTTLSQVTAATGRLSSTEPNLQNIPVKEDDGRAIRKAFIAADGFELLSLDYSQIELRILAHYSKDKHLLQAYREDQDIHDQAAYLLFLHNFDAEEGEWLDENITDDHTNYEVDFKILEKMKKTSEFKIKRNYAKILNFSIAYGVTQWGLAQNINIDQKEAKQLIDLYFKSFPGIKNFMNEMIEQTRKSGFTENFFGRRRNIVNINIKNRFQREAAERLAINTPIQSTAADIIKLAMIEIEHLLKKNNLKTRMLLQIHDELLFEVPQKEKEQVYDLVKQCMENVVSFDVPLKVSGNYGKNWDDSK